MKSIHIVVASKNPVKINATLQAFKAVFPHHKINHQTVTVPSNVPAQPMTDDQTRRGAVNRAQNAAHKHPQADYWVGLEGGIDRLGDTYYSFAWAAVKHRHHIELSRTATFSLPTRVSKLIDQGIELGFAMDQAYRLINSKHQQGAIGYFTHNLISRTDLYVPALTIALSRLPV